MSNFSKFIVADATYTMTTGLDNETPVNVYALTKIFKSAATRHGFGLQTGSSWDGAGIVQIIPKHEVSFATFQQCMEDVATACNTIVFLAPLLDSKGVEFMEYPAKTVASAVRSEAFMAAKPRP